MRRGSIGFTLWLLVGCASGTPAEAPPVWLEQARRQAAEACVKDHQSQSRYYVPLRNLVDACERAARRRFTVRMPAGG